MKKRYKIICLTLLIPIIIFSGYSFVIKMIIDHADKESSAISNAEMSFLKNAETIKTASKDNRRENTADITERKSRMVYLRGRTKEKLVALTFDDGPDDKVTPQILNILKENNVKASFFFLGNKVNVYPDVVKQTFENGNLVLNHSYTHARLTELSKKEIKEKIISSENAIYKVINKKPAMFRPPYGDTNNLVISVCKSLHYKIVLWSIDSMDWAENNEDIIVKNVVDNIRPGDIVLMHGSKDTTIEVKVLPNLIPRLKEKGYRFVTLDEMLKIKAYKE